MRSRRVGRRSALTLALSAAALLALQLPVMADNAPDPGPKHPAFVPEYADHGLLREQLVSNFPETFGGLVYDEQSDTISVLQTASGSGLEQFVRDWLAKGAASSRVKPPSVVFASADTTLRELRDLKERVSAEAAELETSGVDVQSVGIRDSDGSLVVSVADPSEAAKEILASRYGGDRVQHVLGPVVTTADRFSDSPAWNGGDFLITEEFSGGDFSYCTSGFGVKKPNGDRFLLTAGHCDAHFWWNTNPFAIDRSASTFVGYSTSILDGTYSGKELDNQLVRTPDGSSRIIWSGNPPVRKYISGSSR